MTEQNKKIGAEILPTHRKITIFSKINNPMWSMIMVINATVLSFDVDILPPFSSKKKTSEI